MAEYDERGPDDNCGHCIFFQKGTTSYSKSSDSWLGLCTKHPRLHQKTDDVTWGHLWCEHFEEKTMHNQDAQQGYYKSKMELEEAAAALKGSEGVKGYYDKNMRARNEHVEQVPPPSQNDCIHRVIEELRVMQKELYQFDSECSTGLVQAARNGDSEAQKKLAGMIQVTTLILTNLKNRVEELKATLE